MTHRRIEFSDDERTLSLEDALAQARAHGRAAAGRYMLNGLARAVGAGAVGVLAFVAFAHADAASTGLRGLVFCMGAAIAGGAYGYLLGWRRAETELRMWERMAPRGNWPPMPRPLPPPPPPRAA